MKLRILKNSPDAMLHGSPLRSIIIFGLPIILGNVFQQLYSMVDSIVVGNYEGAGRSLLWDLRLMSAIAWL